MDSKRKRYVQIDSNTSTNEIFALLDAVDSEDEEEIDNELNDSDTEFYIEDSAELDTPKMSNDDTTYLY